MAATELPASYLYTLVFDLIGFDPATAQITGTLAVDDTATIRLNGTVDRRACVQLRCVDSAVSITSGFVAGSNTLTIEVMSIGGPAGLQINATATATDDDGWRFCPRHHCGRDGTGSAGTAERRAADAARCCPPVTPSNVIIGTPVTQEPATPTAIVGTPATQERKFILWEDPTATSKEATTTGSVADATSPLTATLTTNGARRLAIDTRPLSPL